MQPNLVLIEVGKSGRKKNIPEIKVRKKSHSKNLVNRQPYVIILTGNFDPQIRK